MKCTELVMQDHAVLRRALDVLDGMIRKLEQGERIEIADAMSILQFIKLFGKDCVQGVEEEILFPSLLRALTQDNRIQQMLFQHDEQRALLSVADDALHRRRGAEFVQSSKRLSVLSRSHFDNEEAMLQDLVETCLSEEDHNALASELMKNRKQPPTHVNLSRLESKYAPKPIATPLRAGRQRVQVHGFTSHA